MVVEFTAPAKGMDILVILNLVPILNIQRIIEAKVAVVEYWSMPLVVPSRHETTSFGVIFEDCKTYFKAVTFGKVPEEEVFDMLCSPAGSRAFFDPQAQTTAPTAGDVENPPQTILFPKASTAPAKGGSPSS